jgi:DegV family protein with EDD domain
METETQNSIGVIADEMGDLPQSAVEANQISIVKFKIEYGELEKFEGNVYQKIRAAEAAGMPPFIKTSQPSINGFLTAYQEKLKQFEQVICVTFSSKISGAYNSALQAVKFLPKNLQEKVFVIDSFAGTASEGLIILRIVEMIKDAKLKADGIVAQIKNELQNFKLVATYDKPKWIEASGRLPPLLPIALNHAEMRNIKPIFALKGGKLSIISIKKNLQGLAATIFDEFEKQTKNLGKKKIKVAITHADNPVEAGKLENLVKTKNNLELIYTDLVCYAIGSHVGPGTLILSYEL